ncbi:hypothetical protein GGX14DRAFT_540548, partial [Mycena pura]
MPPPPAASADLRLYGSSGSPLRARAAASRALGIRHWIAPGRIELCEGGVQEAAGVMLRMAVGVEWLEEAGGIGAGLVNRVGARRSAWASLKGLRESSTRRTLCEDTQCQARAAGKQTKPQVIVTAVQTYRIIVLLGPAELSYESTQRWHLISHSGWSSTYLGKYECAGGLPSRPMHLMSAAAVLLFVSRRRPARPRHQMALLLLPFSTGRRRHWQFLELEATGATRCERAGRHRQAARWRWRKAPDARAMHLCAKSKRKEDRKVQKELQTQPEYILSTDLDDTQRLPAQTRLNIGSAAPILAFSLLQLLQTQASPQTRHRTHQPKYTP